MKERSTSASTRKMKPFKKTAKQHAAIKLLGSAATKIMLYGGSRSGKTFILIYALIVRALKSKSRHLIVRYRFNHAKTSIWMDTLPKVVKLCFPDLPIKWNHSDYFITFPNGSEIWVGGLDDKERTEKILGREYSTIYYNECSQLTYASIETANSRLAEASELTNKLYFDCNPPSKRHWSYKMFVEKKNPESNVPFTRPKSYVSLIMNPKDNMDNIDKDYIEDVLGSMSERKRRRFEDGEWMDDNDAALWADAMISAYRVKKEKIPDMQRIVVGVDPAVSAKATSDETGIICVGKANGHAYVFEDRSLIGKPLQWAREVVTCVKNNEADRVIGEVNNGGDLVEANLRNVDPDISYKSVRASRGKYTRAEPVAALYEQGRVHHVGEFQELEDQMCEWNPEDEDSPDRIDALVWAITELGLTSTVPKLHNLENKQEPGPDPDAPDFKEQMSKHEQEIMENEQAWNTL